MIELSASRARRLVICRQGLHKRNCFGKGDAALLECIERLGYIQIDTISVINRAHHHTFWTRIPKYQEDQLDVLQRDRKIFEYWSHAAAYLPMGDYRFCLPYMNAIASGEKHWRKPDRSVMKAVMKRIQREGALRARDFDSRNESVHQTKGVSAGKKSKVNGDAWGGPKPAKMALEQLFIEGQLMISHRDGFQKVFDLPERVLPDGLDTQTPTTQEFCRYLIERMIHAQGIVTDAEVGYLRKGIKSDLKTQIQQMLEEDEIVEVGVRGNPNTYYSRIEFVEQASSPRVKKDVHLLSPFDNLVIQRKRMMQLFDFDYQIECYVPQNDRVHGYFCLPILFGDELVGRLDPKADRKNSRLKIHNLVVEKEIKQRELFADALAKKLKALAEFNDCQQVVIGRCNNRDLKSMLKDLLS